MDVENLSEDQRAALTQFQEITNVTENDIAIAILASMDWDVGRAMEVHFAGQAEPVHDAEPEITYESTRPAGTLRRSTPEPEPEREEEMEEAPAPSKPAHCGGANFENFPTEPSSSRSGRHRVAHVPRAALAHRNGVVRDEQPVAPRRYANVVHVSDDDMDVDDLSYNDSRSDHDDSLAVVNGKLEHQVPLVPTDCDDVREAVNNFSTVFDARYRTSGRNVSPSFFVGGLHDALKEAFDPPGRGASDKKPLAIYLHHDRSIAANIFPSKVLCSDTVCSLLRHQFIMWPWDVTQAENKDKLNEWLTMCNLEHVSQILSMRTRTNDAYPVLLLLIKEKGVTTLADMCLGTDTVETVVGKIMSVVDTHNKIRLNDMVEESERIERDRIRQEQALEYEMSLAADRARVEQKEREIREQQEAEESRRREEEEERMMRQLLESALPEEPSATEPGVLHVKFRMPGGEQLMRRFRSSEKLSVLLTFLSSKGFSSDKFKYFNSDFPKKEVTGMDASSTFANLKWPTREQVFVEEI